LARYGILVLLARYGFEPYWQDMGLARYEWAGYAFLPLLARYGIFPLLARYGFLALLASYGIGKICGHEFSGSGTKYR